MSAAEPGTTASRSNRVIVRTAVRRFVVLSVVTLLVLAVGALLVCRRIAQDSALAEARLRGATLAGTVAAPLVDERVREQDPEAMASLGAVLLRSMEVGSISHVKLWTPEGRILWSDETELIGRTFDLEPVVDGLVGSTRTVAELSSLDKAENASERSEKELLEVYAGARDADGKDLVFEAYYSTGEMRAREHEILTAILPVALGGLLLFQVAVMPLAISLARRVERGELQRIRLLRQTVLTTHRERLRIARDLHDGVVQDLAGLRYALPVVAAHVSDAPEAAPARDTLEQAREILGRDVEALRSLLVDIHPPGLEGTAFRDAVEDLAERTRRAGPEVYVTMPDRSAWSIDVARVCYRVVQEALRNVATHAQAQNAWVDVAGVERQVRVSVADDGRGMPPGDPDDGHVGLRLLADHLEDLGGSLEVARRPGGGTLLTALVPADLPAGT
ncbi:sensor histidine kinase [Phycicoccus sonneratiae]|uniref:Histidine kinase domain-containing protein n=1 Tax=Phycicoccus sonneratiae TaxID=2807628 RepID=A0ABS2CGC0_9MICO|nr:histidine kinase [Phycicoccus sonneraticus]MBM6398922.1 hypothetical protein [Phycicoccus sonneraticus]